jgi:hypothetical protein
MRVVPSGQARGAVDTSLKDLLNFLSPLVESEGSLSCEVEATITASEPSPGFTSAEAADGGFIQSRVQNPTFYL